MTNNYCLKVGMSLLVTVTALSVLAETYYVSQQSTAATDFKSWETAATNIHDAIDIADDGDLILVADGVYTNTNLRYISGSGAGVSNVICIEKAITLKSVNGPHATIISAAGSPRPCRVMMITAGATIDGFTIEGGNIKDASVSSTLGGGIYLTTSANNATIRNCVISNNVGRYYGGGIYATNIRAVVRNCIISGNYTKTSGTTGNDGFVSENVIMSNCCIGVTNDIPCWNVYGNITNTPIFEAASPVDCHLTKKSPCIDTGVNLEWMTEESVDLDQQRRVRGARVDIGCYEFEPSGFVLLVL